MAARAGRGVHDARGGDRLVGRRPRRPQRRVPRAATAIGWRAAPGATGRGPSCSTTGRATYFDFDHDRLVAIARRPRTWASSCSSSTTAGSASATRRLARLATGSSTGASCRAGSRRWPGDVKAWGSSSGSGSSPRWSARDSDLFRAHPDWAIGVPGRPRTECRATARARLRPAGGRRPPRGRAVARCSRARPSLRQVGHEPQPDRAVGVAPAGRSPGRVLPPPRPGHVRAVPRA